jgi:hypothetical protein
MGPVPAAIERQQRGSNLAGRARTSHHEASPTDLL